MIESNIRVKYQDSELGELTQAHGTDWVDLRVSVLTSVDFDKKLNQDDRFFQFVNLRKGDEVKIYFGVAMQLPANHEAIIKPRGSLFKNHGLIWASSGVVDEGFCGDEDEWFGVFYATRSTTMQKNERICQFRIQEKQPALRFTKVAELGNANRGGHGSTGKL